MHGLMLRPGLCGCVDRCWDGWAYQWWFLLAAGEGRTQGTALCSQPCCLHALYHAPLSEHSLHVLDCVPAVPILAPLSRDEKLTLLDAFEERTYHAKEVVVRQVRRACTDWQLG